MAPRSLWPREHGAYFQLAMPLVAACTLRVPTPAMIALSVAAALAFVANEPLLVVLGHRGPRMRAQEGVRARLRLALLTGAALILGACGLALAPAGTIAVAALAAVPAAVVVGFAWRRAEHTIAGELVAAIALTGASVPVMVAGGAARSVALVTWAAWAVGFGAAVIAVHRVIARHRRAASSIDRVIAVGMGAITWASLAITPLVTAAPLAALATILVIAPPPARRLRAVGIAIAAAALGAGVLMRYA